VAWLQKPDEVSKGAQDATKVFSKEIAQMLEKNSQAITELYFKTAVAKVILFKYIEKLISKASWYNQAYRAQAVAYTMSHLSFVVSKTGNSFNFNYIWNHQSVPSYLEDFLNITAKEIYLYITTPKDGYGNPSQWCKREICWDEVKALKIDINIDERLLINKEDIFYIAKSAKVEKSLDSGIEIQSFVVTQNPNLWKSLVKYYGIDNNISQMQMDILSKYANGRLTLPTEKQSKVIYDLYNAAISEGFIFNA